MVDPDVIHSRYCICKIFLEACFEAEYPHTSSAKYLSSLWPGTRFQLSLKRQVSLLMFLLFDRTWSRWKDTEKRVRLWSFCSLCRAMNFSRCSWMRPWHILVRYSRSDNLSFVLSCLQHVLLEAIKCHLRKYLSRVPSFPISSDGWWGLEIGTDEKDLPAD